MKRRITVLITLVIVCAGIYGLRQIYVENSNPVFNDNAQTVNTHNVSPQKLFDKNWHVIKNEYYDSSFNDQHWNRWKEHYQNKIKTADDAKVATDTMLASLNDPYSRFMSKEEFAKQNNSISSKISGIGVSIINDSGKIRIINVIDQAPAQFAGLKSGDIITAVDGKKVSGLSLAEVSNLVKGLPNTIVTIEIQRRTEKIEKKIIRKEITIKTVKSTNYKDIGYIQISSFISSSTPNEFLEALENTINTKGLIIDLRGNSGGLLSNAVFIANLFINKGRLVSIVGRNGYRHDIDAQRTDVNINKPIVILVDETSASASEILSGALKDYHKAKLVGTRTFGKGMVQKIIPMPNETGLNLTIAKYLTPAGHDINKKGISPDVEITLTKNDLDTKTDSQLEFAKNMLHTILAKGK
ncbi:MAG: S41 family peptidase [Cyanobacteriota bacterium]|nr:S41 family peptidase [Cyanobacteriota bacterium]MDY6382571.1 S41 family peptidase [Cyanobacteriota bacterium]